MNRNIGGGGNGGGFTISTVLSEGIELTRESALAFNVGLVGTRSLVGRTANLTLGRIECAGRTNFFGNCEEQVGRRGWRRLDVGHAEHDAPGMRTGRHG